jgi:HD-like signal output (HDOD) protein
MPAVMVEFMALEGDPDVPMDKFCAILNRDTALTGALFRVANSPVFGLGRVDNLNRAMTAIGIKNAGAIVRSQSMRRSLDDPRYMAFMNMLWDRLDNIAALSVRIIKVMRARYLPTDLAYMLGIFHDSGLAVLCKRFESYARAFANFDVWPDVPALDLAHQTNHAVVGQMLARTWQLPPGLVQAIRHHHEPRAFAELSDVVCKLILVLQFAIHMHDRIKGRPDQEWEAAWKSLMLERFDLTPASLEELELSLLEGDD